MTNVRSALYSLCESALNARAQISADKWIHSLSQKMDVLSIGQTYMHALKKYLPSWV